MIDYLIFFVVFLGLLVGSITDIQRREVPDWISWGMVFAGLGLRLIYSLVTAEWGYFLFGLLGFAILFALAYLMFYTGQWGGGDSKLLIAMGALLATTPEFITRIFDPFLGGFPFLISFWFNLLVVGAVYAIIWSLVVAVMDFSDFRKKVKEKLDKPFQKKIRFFLYGFSLVFIFVSLFIPDLLIRLMIITVALLSVFFYFMWIFIKSVEEACMYKKVLPEDLTEGDWIVKDIFVDGKYICGPKNLGVEMRHIRQLKKFHERGKIKTVLIKTGIPFIPSFFVAFIVTFVWGNFIFYYIM